jgi:DNA invertase Pin-like site-specific DNA recombinase
MDFDPRTVPEALTDRFDEVFRYAHRLRRKRKRFSSLTKGTRLRFERKSLLLPETAEQIRTLREAGTTVPEIIRRTGLSKASVYRALAASAPP